MALVSKPSGGGALEVNGVGTVELWLDDRVTLESEGEEGVERVTCSGRSSELRQASFALVKGKKVTRARFRMSLGDEEWGFGWEAGRIQFQSMRFLTSGGDRREDPYEALLERIGLVQKRSVFWSVCSFSSWRLDYPQIGRGRSFQPWHNGYGRGRGIVEGCYPPRDSEGSPQCLKAFESNTG